MARKEDNNPANICSTIQSAGSIDPFEGLNLDEICVPPRNMSHPEPDPANNRGELFDLNPLDDIDIEEMSVPPSTLATIKVTHTPKTVSVSSIESTATESDTLEGDRAFTESRERLETVSPQDTHINNQRVSPVIEKAYHYAELTRIREKIFSSLEKSGGNTLLIASPYDNTGSSLLAAALGYNAACSCQQKVLLIDCNMRRAGLHKFFNLPQPFGFTEFVRDNLPMQAVVKKTGVTNLDVITAGENCQNFSDYLRHSHIPKILQESRNTYDFIIFDTSPVLSPNRNNVNIVSLTSVVDYFLLITKQSGTTRADLKETKSIIEAGNGTIHGIVLNEHTPDKQASPYPH